MASRRSALRAVDPDHVEQLGSVEDFVGGLPDEFVKCRAYGHRFDPYTVTKYRNALVVMFRCSRCKTKKRQTMSTRGMLLGNTNYDHPDGYLHKGHGQIATSGEGRGIVRLNAVMRVGRLVEIDEEYENHGT